MIHYGPAGIAKQVSAIVATSSETLLLEIKDPRFLEKSQISVYIDATLGTSGGNAKINLRYYASFDGGTTYYQIPVKNLSTGEIINLPSLVDSNSPAKFVEDIPLSGANAFKVTSQTDVGTATVNFATLVVRDN